MTRSRAFFLLRVLPHCTPVSQRTQPIAPARGPSLRDEAAARLGPLRPEMKQWLSVGKWVSVSKEYLNFGTKRMLPHLTW